MIHPLTHSEQIALYMKCSKKQLAEMLYECNRIIDSRPMEIWQTEFKMPDEWRLNIEDGIMYYTPIK